eukprot:1141866-Pelagomonas_calceolata.AAC.4
MLKAHLRSELCSTATLGEAVPHSCIHNQEVGPKYQGNDVSYVPAQPRTRSWQCSNYTKRIRARVPDALITPNVLTMHSGRHVGTFRAEAAELGYDSWLTLRKERHQEKRLRRIAAEAAAMQQRQHKAPEAAAKVRMLGGPAISSVSGEESRA